MYWLSDRTERTFSASLARMVMLSEEDAAGTVATIRSDPEYASALQHRDDIVACRNDRAAKVIETLSLCCAILIGVWMTTGTLPDISADFHEQAPAPRIATLHRTSRYADSLIMREYETEPYPPPKVIDYSPADMPVRAEALHQHDPAGKNGRLVRSAAAAPDKAREENDLQFDELPAQESHDTKHEHDGDHEPPVAADQSNPLHALRRRLEQNPDDADALSAIGGHYLHSGLLDSAKDLFYRALAVSPDLPSVHNKLGTTHYFLSTFTDNPRYVKRKGIADPAGYKKTLYDSAVASYTRALSLDSSFVEAITNRGVVHALFGNRENAIQDYTRAIRIDATWADAYTKRAAAYNASGNYAAAVKDYTAAIKLDSSRYRHNPSLRFANAYYGRGISFYRMRAFVEAGNDFDAALALQQNHRLALLYKGIVQGRQKQYDAAAETLGRALRMLSPLEYNGAQMVGYLHRGTAFKALEEYDKAIADFKIARTLPRLAGQACWRIAQCYSLKKEYDAALVWLQHAVSEGFTNVHLWKRDPALAPLRHNAVFLGIVADQGSGRKNE